jgi:hypothetical protein|tara:strand:+ start:607 stop:1200 length:594 start_codon:yes stop_codon:yes gene_type:complete
MFDSLKADQVSFGELKTKLFSYEELERILNLRPFMSVNRFKVCNSVEKFTWANNIWSTDKYCWPSDVIEKLTKDQTCYITDCSKINKRINIIAQHLENRFKKAVDCHIYFSLNRKANHFKKHKDKSHNLIVASEGVIKVKIFSETVIEKVLKTGEYVFIPADIYHYITPQTDKRISCSFPITLIEGILENRKWITIT